MYSVEEVRWKKNITRRVTEWTQQRIHTFLYSFSNKSNDDDDDDDGEDINYLHQHTLMARGEEFVPHGLN